MLLGAGTDMKRPADPGVERPGLISAPSERKFSMIKILRKSDIFYGYNSNKNILIV